MDIILYDLSWMAFNVFLALIAVFFGWLVLRRPVGRWENFFRLMSGIIWLIFLPNTIYLFTDLTHIMEQWADVGDIVKIILVFQYASLIPIGLATFILSFYPFEKLLKSLQWHKNKWNTYFVIALHFIVGFGVVLGRVERINSWEAFTATEKVIRASLHVFSSPELILLAILFGLFGNFLYFLFREPVIIYFSRVLRELY